MNVGVAFRRRERDHARVGIDVTNGQCRIARVIPCPSRRIAAAIAVLATAAVLSR
jgi:hypothetical protein